jgi:hypothetical protein
LYAGLLPLQR